MVQIELESESTITDTDKESVRIKRAKNQARLYSLIPDYKGKILNSFAGLSVVDRFIDIRAALFPLYEFQFIDEEGILPFQLISRRIERDYLWYPRLEIVTSDLLPSLFKLIDETYEQITFISKQDEKDSAALRLVSALYTLGITIHPTANGNGQTFKTMVLTYLHELSPKFKERYFPIKFSDNLKRYKYEINTLFTDKFSEIGIPIINPRTEEDKELIKMYLEIRQIKRKPVNKDVDYRVYEYEKNRDIYILVKEYAERLKIPQLLNRFKPIYWRKPIRIGGRNFSLKFLGYKIGHERAPQYADVDLESNLYDIFISRGYDPDVVRATFLYGTPKIARTTNSMFTLLHRNDNPNIKLIKDYILGIPVDVKITDDRGKQVLQIALEQFNEVEKEIERLLSDDSISSIAAVRDQLRLASRYEHIALKLDNLKLTNFPLWRDINDLMLELPKDRSQEDEIQFLEDQVVKLGI